MKILRRVGFLTLLAFSIVFPLLFSDAVTTTVAIFTLIIMAAATGWNLFAGSTRYLSLGHATFYGLGAYILGGICQVGHLEGGIMPMLFLPIVGLITGLCALPLGWIALQTRRFTFMVITITIFSLVSLLPQFLPQAKNLYLPIPPWSGDSFNIPFYYAALLLLFCALLVAWAVRASRFGLCLLAIGNDEDRALGLGNKVAVHKLLAWILSATFVGMAGALNAYYLGVLDPTTAFTRSINVALPATVFIGGIGTLTGPLLGTLFTVPLQQYLTLQYGNVQGLDLILYGVILLLVILVLPQGVVPVLQKRILAVLRVLQGAGQEQTLGTSDLLGVSALVAQPLFPYGAAGNAMNSVLGLEAMGHSNSQPLKRGNGSLKASRLVPLARAEVGESRSTGSMRRLDETTGSMRKFPETPTGSMKISRLVPFSEKAKDTAP